MPKGISGSNKPLPSSVKLTDNKKYGIYPEDAKNVDKKTKASLFVNTKVEGDKFQGLGNEKPSPTTYTHGTDSFERYQFQKGVKDCAHNAEEFQHGKPLATKHANNEYTLASKETVTGQVFGYSDADNIGVSKQAKKKDSTAVNHGADPKPGESYGIIRQHAPGENQSPFHFAPVVAKDGKQTITAEQTAGTTDATARNTYPTMDMYRVGDKNESFKARYGTADGYGKDSVVVTTQKWGPQKFQDGDDKPDAEQPPSKKQRTE
ncbi:hypothetical protein [Vitiosangium sp. GDMCC 1.1324]|uniref:hypothetical protein n=1 Tax=Vitiosangium sp. (strain GDMCC 1.1324) TaxID=2138576 RepID=UPI000D344913|nr:hypothetical protein [Vitiosangium sp. GDMCC 1.1324]PTL79766.1 hypothetical protein DAT35_33770 [Vitiosangium sp. GDMCC 1.1324]